MGLHKKIGLQTLAHYQAWNEQKRLHESLTAGQKTPAQKWEEYKAFFAFARQIKPKPSDGEVKKRAEEWEECYRRVIEFEKRRRQRGRQA